MLHILHLLKWERNRNNFPKFVISVDFALCVIFGFNHSVAGSIVVSQEQVIKLLQCSWEEGIRSLGRYGTNCIGESYSGMFDKGHLSTCTVPCNIIYVTVHLNL